MNAMSAWMPMPGEAWWTAAAAFLGMWSAMMAPMMLPSFVPMLRRYRRSLGTVEGSRREGLALVATAGYAFVWAAIGIAAFASGSALAAIEARLPGLGQALSNAAGVVALAAGALQFTRWKARHLACCREMPDGAARLRASTAAAWRDGIRLGVHCACSSAGPTALLFALGMMDTTAMVLVTIAITVERLAPPALRAPQVVGAIMIGAGLFLLA
jgi:predicted metal-binding membrane protein